MPGASTCENISYEGSGISILLFQIVGFSSDVKDERAKIELSQTIKKLQECTEGNRGVPSSGAVLSSRGFRVRERIIDVK